MRTIVGVAFRKGSLVQYLPKPNRHHHIIKELSDLLGGPVRNFEQGFLCSEGHYVTRKEAWPIAEAAGQLLSRAPTGSYGTLFSEDGW